VRDEERRGTRARSLPKGFSRQGRDKSLKNQKGWGKKRKENAGIGLISKSNFFLSRWTAGRLRKGTKLVINASYSLRTKKTEKKTKGEGEGGGKKIDTS